MSVDRAYSARRVFWLAIQHQLLFTVVRESRCEGWKKCLRMLHDCADLLHRRVSHEVVSFGGIFPPCKQGGFYATTTTSTCHTTRDKGQRKGDGEQYQYPHPVRCYSFPVEMTGEERAARRAFFVYRRNMARVLSRGSPTVRITEERWTASSAPNAAGICGIPDDWIARPGSFSNSSERVCS